MRYTDDFLIFAHEKPLLRELGAAVAVELSGVRLRLAVPKSRVLATREGVAFCGFRYRPGLRPRILGATKRRFERRRRLWAGHRAFCRLGTTVRAWYAFSREANATGLRRAYARSRICGSPP